MEKKHKQIFIQMNEKKIKVEMRARDEKTQSWQKKHTF